MDLRKILKMDVKREIRISELVTLSRFKINGCYFRKIICN